MNLLISILKTLFFNALLAALCLAALLLLYIDLLNEVWLIILIDVLLNTFVLLAYIILVYVPVYIHNTLVIREKNVKELYERFLWIALFPATAVLTGIILLNEEVLAAPEFQVLALCTYFTVYISFYIFLDAVASSEKETKMNLPQVLKDPYYGG